jgi:pSer/pThr/pTyr-binding forkhead associated (FHA) protein
MRLLKIGRDASCDIILHSDKVSSFHAEMTMLNNGDILLEDKNSMNGTYLMNKPIKSGTPVTVRRGDAIRFADVELQWNQIPSPENNSNFKGIFGIGSNFRNEIQVIGNTVSRFHATLKLGKDGKTYIQDHSKNGTTINGTRIGFEQNVRVKRKDVIVCGGVPVDIKRFIPAPAPIMKIVAAIGVVAVIIGCILWWKPDSKPSIKALESATACVYGQYYIKVTFQDDPFVERIDGWPKEWIFGIPKGATEYALILGTLTNKEIQPISYTGTAFFISKKGELGTNRHIAVPWEYLSKEDEESIRQQIQNIITDENLNRFLVNILSNAIDRGTVTVQDARSFLIRMQKSPINISGKLDFLGIALSGSNITAPSDLLTCQVIAESGGKNKDVALLRLNNKTTPSQIVKDGFFDITQARTDENSLVPQEETLTTIGYPAGFQIGFFTANTTELMPTVHKVYISKTPDENGFQFQGQAVGGQSGSPIIDRQYRLVGVLYGGFNQTEFSYGCNIKHLVELYDKHKAKE